MLKIGMAAAILAGCGTTSISPAMTGKSGVKYGIDKGGYPTIAEIAFIRPTRLSEHASQDCIIRGVEQPVNTPTQIAGAWQVTAIGAMYWEGGGVSSQPFRYNLSLVSASGTTYTFTRMVYATNGVGSASPLLASKWWSPQYAYAAMEEVVERIDQCLIAKQ